MASGLRRGVPLRPWESLAVVLVWIQAQVPLDRARLTNSATRRCNPADWLADQGTGQGIPGCDQPAAGATVDATVHGGGAHRP